jgi:hypothetical protein
MKNLKEILELKGTHGSVLMGIQSKASEYLDKHYLKPIRQEFVKKTDW